MDMIIMLGIWLSDVVTQRIFNLLFGQLRNATILWKKKKQHIVIMTKNKQTTTPTNKQTNKQTNQNKTKQK